MDINPVLPAGTINLIHAHMVDKHITADEVIARALHTWDRIETERIAGHRIGVIERWGDTDNLRELTF